MRGGRCRARRLRWIAAEARWPLRFFWRGAALFGRDFSCPPALFRNMGERGEFPCAIAILNVFGSFFLYSAVSPLSELRAG
jgi:hypothetical protein